MILSSAASCSHTFESSGTCTKCSMTVRSIHEALSYLVDLGVRKEFPTVSGDIRRQAFYVSCRLDGQSHNMAEVLALQSPPGSVGTERAFLEGHCCGNQFEGQEVEGDTLKAMAESAGVCTKGKVYKDGLADYFGDPKAWVSDLHDAKSVAAEKNMTVSGAFSRHAVRGIDDV